ncbi:uncharacterized protein LOC107607005 [Arachis ipaensis]|uniref:uncharacterized protein LOC107607005 n=1 Tax=Arachis ipaensis TaxID=130454 RepID=UPI000A2B039F|nr:uncharacterized protein LOC107607005 [Arachis ipaensis]
MIDASPFSSLEDAISFARQLWFKESRIQSWLDAFSGHSHLFRAIRYAPGSMMREMLHWDRKYRAKFGFEFITSTETWLSQEILDEVKMARKGRYTKKPKSGPGCQQPLTAPPSGSGSHQADSQVLPAGGDGIPPTSRPFRPPRSEPRPATQMSANSVHNSELGQETLLEANAPEVESRDHEDDDHSSASGAQSRKRRKTTEFWTVKIIDSDGTVKPARLSVREAMERPNGRRIVLRFNNEMQPIGDEAGLLSGVLGLLGSDYAKFPIGKESWHKVTTKNKVYNECVKQIFHFDEDSEGSIKKYILQSMGRSWKETRLRLYNAFYEPTFTFEQNIEHRPPEID